METQRSTERMIQEYVPGKQVTLAHLIANPGKDLYKKLGLMHRCRKSRNWIIRGSRNTSTDRARVPRAANRSRVPEPWKPKPTTC